ncbi:hypothetical protein DENSPDRAFT_882747 [Dentipellis sp. KUC8613]|nr:hypothetical protein DENSPDRAFT_882747 [Dentipellis sp. KUC8613]
MFVAGTPSHSSDSDDVSSGRQMRRIVVSPSPSRYRGSGSDTYTYSDDNSIDDAAEVEDALTNLDEELSHTEDALTEWSRGSSSVTPSSYLSGSATSPTFTSNTSSYIPFTNTLRDGRILSTITERTENPSSRPTSYNLSGPRPNSAALGRSSPHVRGATEPASGDRAIPPPGRRAGDLIAFFEDKKSTSASSSSSYGHSRTLSAPSGPRSPSPYTSTSQSMPTFGTSSGTSYGYGSSYGSRPSSPSKSRTGTSSMLSSSVLTPPQQTSSSGEESRTTLTNNFTSSAFTSTSFYTSSDTVTATPAAPGLRRPQTSPRSPLTSVRNIVAAWKERAPPGKSSAISPGQQGVSASRQTEPSPSVRSVPSPTHPTAQDDVGTIAARQQSAAAEAEGGGQLGEMGLLEMLCPFQLLYGDGVERLGAESARERVRWVSAIWEALDRSVTIPDRSETQSPTGSMRTIRSMTSSTHSGSGSGSASTTFVPPMDSIPDLSDFYSISGSSSGSGRRSLSRAVDDATVSNQTYLYPGDPRVIAPSRSSSLRRTTSMTDLDEEFESALRRARESRPGLGFGLSLAGAAPVGEGSPVTVSSGPRLGRDVVVTPPPSGRRSRARSEASVSASDDAFFSSGPYSSTQQSRASTFYSTSDYLRSTTGTGTGLFTDDTLGFTSETATATNILPSTISYRGSSSASHLGDSHDGVDSSSYTPSSPSRSSLARSREVRRRSRVSSRSYSLSYPTGSEEDKENSSYRYSDEYGLSTLESYTRTSFPTSSSARTTDDEGLPSDTTPTTDYRTAKSPSEGSFASLPTIPSDYDTAEVCSTEFGTAEKCSSGSESDFVTIDVAKTEPTSEYATAGVCDSDRSTTFTTAEVCPTEPPTEYKTAECRCKPEEECKCPTPSARSVSEEGVREVEEKELREEGIQTAIPVPPEPVQPEEEEAEVESIIAPSDIPSMPSISVREPPVTRPEDVPLPPSIYSPSLLSSEISSVRDLDLGESVPTPSTIKSVSVGLPSVSLPAPSPIPRPESLPTTSLLSSVTESTPTSMTPSEQSEGGSLPSPHPVPPSPSIRESLWAPETDDSYESSLLRASPSVQSMALPEGADVSFDTSFLRPTASPFSSQDFGRLSTITESPSAPSSGIPQSSSSASPSDVTISQTASSPIPPAQMTPPSQPTVSLATTSSIPTPSVSEEPSSVSLTRTPSSVSTASSISMRSSILDNRSLFEEPFLEERSTVPSLLSSVRSLTPRSLSPAHVPLPSSPSLSMPTPSLSVSMSTPHSDAPSIHSLETIASQGPREIVTHDVNRLLEFLNRVEGLREEDNQGLHDHLNDIQDDPRDIAIPLTPPPLRPLSPTASSLSSVGSFLPSYHSDDFSLMESESYPIRDSLPSSPSSSSSFSSSPSSSSVELPVSTPSSPVTSGPYLSKTSSFTPTPPPSSPTPTNSSSETARPRVQVPSNLEDLRNLLNAVKEVKEDTSALWDGQLSTNHILDELRQRWPRGQDNAELNDRMQRIEDLLQRVLADSQGRPQPPSERPESHYDSGSDISSVFERLRQQWDRRHQDAPALIAPTPMRARSSLDDLMADLLRSGPQPQTQPVQPPPPLVPLIFRPDLRGSRPRSVSPTIATELPPRPHTFPIREEPVIFDRGRRIRRTPRRPAVPASAMPGRTESRISFTPVIPSGAVEQGDQEAHEMDFTMPQDLLSLLKRLTFKTRDVQPQPLRNYKTPAADAPQPGAQPSGVVPPPPPPPGPTTFAVPPVPQPLLAFPPIFNDMMTMLRDNRNMHIASLEQQRELMRYMTALNDWLGRDVGDRQAELRGVTARIDRLRDDLDNLGSALQPQLYPQPIGQQPGMVGGFAQPPPTRPSTMPPGASGYPPPPQIVPGQGVQGMPMPYPMPGMQQPPTVIVPPVVPGSESSSSAVIPSPIDYDRPIVPDIERFNDRPEAPVYRPPIPVGGEPDEPYVPSSPSYRSGHGSDRGSGRGSPLPTQPITIIPPQDRHDQPLVIQPQPTLHVSEPSRSSSSASSSSRSATPQMLPPVMPPPGGTTVIEVPPQVPPGGPSELRDGYPRHPDVPPSGTPVIVEPLPATQPMMGPQIPPQPLIIQPMGPGMPAIEYPSRHSPQRTPTRPMTHRTASPPLSYEAPSEFPRGEPTRSEYERQVRDAAHRPDVPFIPVAPSQASRRDRPAETAPTAPTAPTILPSEEESSLFREEPPMAEHIPYEPSISDGRRSPSMIEGPPRTAEDRAAAPPGAEPSRAEVPPAARPRGEIPSGPGDLDYEDTERERHQRFDELQQQLVSVAKGAEEAEDKREHEFQQNEDERERIFMENEDRRQREAQERRDAILQDLEDRLQAPASTAPIPVPPPDVASLTDKPSVSDRPSLSERPESVIEPLRDAAVLHANDIKDIVTAEREEMAREREAADAERQQLRAEAEEARQKLDEERQTRIRELEEELARVRAELDSERQLRATEEVDRREQERQEDLDRNEAITNQLRDITDLVQQQRDEYASKKDLMDERWNDKLNRRQEKENKWEELHGMVFRILQVQEEQKVKCDQEREEAAGKPGIEQIIEQLRKENQELRELFQSFADNLSAESVRQHETLLNNIRATAQEQVPFNVQGYLDEFSKSLAAEVRMLLGEVGRLREERRALQYELGCLMCMRSKYGPGGEFDPEWKPTTGPLAPGGPAADAPPPPPEAPPPPPEHARPAWRSVPTKGSRRLRRKSDGPPASAPQPPPPPPHEISHMMPPIQEGGRAGSWATWLPDPNIEYTPPPTEPTTLLAPPEPQRGLFGPRSPRDSRVG